MTRPLLIIAMSLLGACSQAPQPVDENEVRIVRDDYGVPHICADTVFGLYYSYGYAVAQDRLFQMEMESDDASLLEVNLILQTWDRESRDEKA